MEPICGGFSARDADNMNVIALYSHTGGDSYSQSRTSADTDHTLKFYVSAAWEDDAGDLRCEYTYNPTSNEHHLILHALVYVWPRMVAV